jgi:hypothetical protein
MNQIQELYLQFLNIFPGFLHPVISIILAVLLVIAVIQVIKRNFIYIILLVILLPASLPILRNVWQSVVELFQFLIRTR